MDSFCVMRKQALPKSVRVKNESEFRRIVERGDRKHGPHLILFRLQGAEGDGQRFGIKIARGVKRAVARNSMKRVLRETLRKNKHKFGANESVVVICKTAAEQVASKRLREQLEALIL